MLKDSKIIAFVGTTAPGEARRFYEDQLGLEFLADEPSALLFDSNGTMLRVSKVASFQPAPFTVLGWEVDDIRVKVAELVERGVACEHFEGIEQDERGIAAFPDGTMVAWFKDPDGNVLSLTQFNN